MRGKKWLETPLLKQKHKNSRAPRGTGDTGPVLVCLLPRVTGGCDTSSLSCIHVSIAIGTMTRRRPGGLR